MSSDVGKNIPISSNEKGVESIKKIFKLKLSSFLSGSFLHSTFYLYYALLDRYACFMLVLTAHVLFQIYK